MMIKAKHWINAKMELTKIGMEWAKIMTAAQKYQWIPEFLWTKQQLEEVLELYERAYELARREFEIFLITEMYDRIPTVTDTFDRLDSEIWDLKSRLATMVA